MLRKSSLHIAWTIFMLMNMVFMQIGVDFLHNEHCHERVHDLYGKDVPQTDYVIAPYADCKVCFVDVWCDQLFWEETSFYTFAPIFNTLRVVYAHPSIQPVSRYTDSRAPPYLMVNPFHC